jgi:hypothetical protein
MIKITGLEELEKNLKDLADKAAALDGEHNVKASELLHDDFIARHTNFSSLEDMFKAGGFEVKTQEEFDALPQEELDTFIRSISTFESWDEMIHAAGAEWAGKQLGHE